MMRQLSNSQWVYVRTGLGAAVVDAVEALDGAGNMVLDVIPLYEGSYLTGALIRCSGDVHMPPEKNAGLKQRRIIQ